MNYSRQYKRMINVFGKSVRIACVCLLLFTLISPLTSYAATFRSAKDGNYSANTTWRPQFELKFGSDAIFNSPKFATTDSAGNVYVTDSGNNNVRKFDSNGNQLLQFGSSGSGNGQLDTPSGIAIDTSGNIFVVDSGHHRVQKFNSSGIYQSQFGSYGTGNGQFQTPSGIKIDASNNIYVVERDGARVQKFNSSGVYQSKFGTFGPGVSELLVPNDIAIDGSGNIYVLDESGSKVKKFNSSGVYQSTVLTGGFNGQISSPFGINIDSLGNLYVSDSLSVQVFTTAGVLKYQIGTRDAGGSDGTYLQPRGIAIGPNNETYVLDPAFYKVQKFSTITTPDNTSDVTIDNAVTLSADAQVHNLIIGSSGTFDLNGHTITVMGDWTNTGAFNANGGTVIFQGASNTIIGNNTFYNLTKIESTASTLFLPNATTTITNNLILQGTSVAPIDVTNSQTFTAPFISKFGTYGTGNGQFDSPRDVALDSAGNIYITDTRNNRIEKFNSSGVYLGKFGSNGTAENQFSRPQGIIVDENGYIYISDTNNSRIQKYDSNFNFVKMWGWGVATGASQFEVCTSTCTSGQASNEGDFNGMIWSPSDIVFAPNGNLVVSQSDYNWLPRENMIEFDRDGNFVSRWARFAYNGDETRVGATYGMAIDSQGNYYLGDSGSYRIMKFDANHNFVKMWGWGVATGASQFEVCTSSCQSGISGSGTAQFGYIAGVIEDPDGNILVSDENNFRILRFSPDGVYLGMIGGIEGNGDGEFDGPSGMVIDTQKNLLVMDRYNNRLQKFDLPLTNAIIVPQGTVEASNINVEGIVNVGPAPISCLTGCTDQGGNTGWTFPVIVAASAPVVAPGSQTSASGVTSFGETPQAIIAARNQLSEIVPTLPPHDAAVPNISNLSIAVPPSLANFVFVQSAALGSRSPAIVQLQRFLNLDPHTRIANTGAGSPGKETNLFGPATKSAIQKFQLKYGIVSSIKDSGYGVFGPKTRAKMNELLKVK